jgi:2-polyprenyl-6-methoxyphenol hydroxylase-like FAD-dependent oxidoreductase
VAAVEGPIDKRTDRDLVGLRSYEDTRARRIERVTRMAPRIAGLTMTTSRVVDWLRTAAIRLLSPAP